MRLQAGRRVRRAGRVIGFEASGERLRFGILQGRAILGEEPFDADLARRPRIVLAVEGIRVRGRVHHPRSSIHLRCVAWRDDASAGNDASLVPDGGDVGAVLEAKECLPLVAFAHAFAGPRKLDAGVQVGCIALLVGLSDGHAGQGHEGAGAPSTDVQPAHGRVWDGAKMKLASRAFAAHRATDGGVGRQIKAPTYLTPVRVGLLVLVVGVAAAGCLRAGPAPDAVGAADLILVDGVVWSGDGQWHEAVAIRDGMVVALGANQDAMQLAGDASRVIPLGGAFVSPGWRDHHVHILAALDGATPQQAQAMLRPAPFVETELEAEVRHEADFALQLAYHGSRAVDAALDEDGRNFGPASLYENCGDSGAEGGFEPPTPEYLAALAAAEDELARQGLTTVVEAQLRNMTHVAAVLDLQERGLSKIRWQLRVVPGCYPMLDQLGLTADSPGDWVRLLGVKLYADGYLGAWIAALREPYADRPLWRGVQTYDADTFLYHVREAKERGLTVGTHAIGDASAAQALDAYAAAGVTSDDRFTIEHAQVLGADLIERMAAEGIIASIQYSFSTTDQHFAEDRLGPERLQYAYAWQTLAESGVVLAGSTDYPIEVVTPAWGLQRVVTRAELDGSPPWLESEALTVEQALRGITWGQAYASKEESDRGTLEVGKKADLTVTRQNPFSIAPDELASLTVLLTIVNGQLTFEGEQAYPPPRPWT